MKSYTALRNLYGVLTNNTGTTNLTNGDAWINDAQRILMSTFNPIFTESTATDVTVANQQAYNLPYNYEKLNSVTITLGTYKYPLKEVPDEDYWNQLQITTSFTSNYAQWFFIDAGQINFWPKPSTSSLVITYNYKVLVRDLSNADYTTGTIALTNGSTTVTGTGTTFTAAMVGRYLKSNTDGYWYKIAGFTSTTVLTLAKSFAGTTGSGLAYTIGEMPLVPEAYHQDLVSYATWQYWLTQADGAGRAQTYKDLWEAAIKRCKFDQGNKTNSVAIEEQVPITNPNLFVSY